MAADLAARILALRAPWATGADLTRDVREVVLVGSSSRGGSTIFAEVLRRTPRLVHLRAELNPFLRLVGLHGDDDALAPDTPVPPDLGRLLTGEAGNPTTRLAGADERLRFATEVAIRLLLQWPALPLDVDRIVADTHDVLSTLVRDAGWPEDRFVDEQDFFVRLLARLRTRWPEIHPLAYDLDRKRIAAQVPGPWPDTFVPQALVEESPFVLVVPWEQATAETLATRPLVIKTPSNAWRVGFLRRFFDAAQVRLLHLTRNVAASVNGLYDGWRFTGFHSHEVPTGLAIRGYSDTVPGGDRWWKFDRGPGWSTHVADPLVDVCAFQWRNAHEAILREVGPGDLRLAFEDILGPNGGQRAALERLAGWLGIPVADHLEAILGSALPVVMATEQPRHRRWAARLDLLASLLVDPELLGLMERLGYARDPATWD